MKVWDVQKQKMNVSHLMLVCEYCPTPFRSKLKVCLKYNTSVLYMNTLSI